MGGRSEGVRRCVSESGCVSVSDCGYDSDCRVCHWWVLDLCYVSGSVRRREVLLSAHGIWILQRLV